MKIGWSNSSRRLATTATISRTPMKSRSPSEVPISTGTFNARAASVTAFNATRSDTLKWPIAIRLRWASPSTSASVIMRLSHGIWATCNRRVRTGSRIRHWDVYAAKSRCVGQRDLGHSSGRLRSCTHHKRRTAATAWLPHSYEFLEHRTCCGRPYCDRQDQAHRWLKEFEIAWLVRRSFVQGGHPTLPLCTRYFESDERGTYL